MYVAWSWSTSLQGLHILGKVNSKHAKADSRVRNEYDRLKSLKSGEMQEIISTDKQRMQDSNSVLTLSLLKLIYNLLENTVLMLSVMSIFSKKKK